MINIKINNITFVNFFINFFNIKIKVFGRKNLKDYDKLKLILMSNHMNGIDYAVIVHSINYFTKNKKKIYTIVKHDLLGSKTDKNMISNFLGNFKNNIFQKLNFISYKRDNKNSGNIVKNKMLTILKDSNILLFPEGECTRSGIPKDFKSGSFRLCAENNIWILPISLTFNKKIGVNRTDPVDIKKWFDVDANIYIHKPIFNKDWEKLKNDVFNEIKKPMTYKKSMI
jgi:1-acyl-sn-glycerol-3-phosphate acyltransferase